MNLLIDNSEFSIEKSLYNSNNELRQEIYNIKQQLNEKQQEYNKIIYELQSKKHVDGYFRNLEKENAQLKYQLQAEQQAHLSTMETLDQRTIYWHAIEMENFAVKRENLELKERLKAEQQAHNALRERLKEIEWCGVPGNDICFVCNGDRKHDIDCWLGNAINGKGGSK